MQYTRIAVNGYTDTSGTPRYNMALLLHRAQVVASGLVRGDHPGLTGARARTAITPDQPTVTMRPRWLPA